MKAHVVTILQDEGEPATLDVKTFDDKDKFLADVKSGKAQLPDGASVFLGAHMKAERRVTLTGDSSAIKRGPRKKTTGTADPAKPAAKPAAETKTEPKEPKEPKATKPKAAATTTPAAAGPTAPAQQAVPQVPAQVPAPQAVEPENQVPVGVGAVEDDPFSIE